MTFLQKARQRQSLRKQADEQSGACEEGITDSESRLWRTGVIDIGSNSVRLVVYSGPRRVPAMIFNEKVMAGLGQDLAETGLIPESAMERAINAICRFSALSEQMQVDEIICVATAAVRDAENGSVFAARMADLGIGMDILSGEDEANVAACGVLSAIPDADGIVGDLGGGSLDMARVKDGEVLHRVSLPLGVLRLDGLRDGKGSLEKAVIALLDEHDWLADARDLPFYLVGGSWRAVSRFDIHLQKYPLAVLHHYQMPANRPAKLISELENFSRDELRNISVLPNSRIDHLGNALSLLDIIGQYVGAREYIVSTYGLREGLLYRAMDEQVRQCDPLLVATCGFGRQHGRFGMDGSQLYRWVRKLFVDLDPDQQRWLEAACHLVDSGWQANPDFRAERGLEIALHGHWVGVDAIGRCMMGQALFTGLGGGNELQSQYMPVDEKILEQAMIWGLAIRLGLRIGAGTGAILERSELQYSQDRLVLLLNDADRALTGEVMERRLRKLANALGCDYSIALTR